MLASCLLCLLVIQHTLGRAPLSRAYQVHKQRVAYFQDNDPAGAAIIALRISESDGTLSSPVRTLTGGKGLAGLIAISDDSVTVADDYLFTTNSGDDTVSMFWIDPQDPMHPKIVGTPAPTLGNTPVSVAYSEALKIACALNSGMKAGAACFSVDPQRGLVPLGGLRSVPQIIVDPSNPAKPAPGPLTIAADIAFNPTSTALFFTTGAVNAKAGHIYAYPVIKRLVSMEPVVSSFSNLPFIFSLNFLGHSDERLVSTNPVANAPGAAFLEVHDDLSITYAQTITLPDQQAACWVADVPQLDSVYIIDALQPNFTYISQETGEVKGVVQYDAKPMTGGIDTAVLRDYLYFLTDNLKDPKINVFQLGDGGEPKFVQSFDIFKEVGVIPFWMGLGVWPKD